MDISNFRPSLFVLKHLSQRARPSLFASTTVISTQAIGSWYLVDGLVQCGMRKEALVNLMTGVISTLFHLCEERVYCPVLDVEGWRVLDIYASMLTLTACALVLAGIQHFNHWVAAFGLCSGVIAASLGMDSGDSIRVQVAAWVVYGVMVRASWSIYKTHKGLQIVLISSTLGLMMPALGVLYASNYLGQRAGRPREGVPQFPMYWVGHSVWHAMSIFCTFTACSSRCAHWKKSRPKKPARKLGTNRMLISVLWNMWKERGMTGKYGYQRYNERRKAKKERERQAQAALQAQAAQQAVGENTGGLAAVEEHPTEETASDVQEEKKDQ